LRSPSLRWRELLETAVTIGVAVVWFVALRPVALGGPASYIVVHGYSMSGTLAPGDLVVTTRQSSYAAGDAIVYRVSSGAGRGLLVVHRIIRADESGYTMRGDANSYVDPWIPKTSDVVGRLVVTLPGLGRMLAGLANPFVLAAVWGLAALILGLSILPDPGRPALDVGSMLKKTTVGATSVMVALVLISAGITLSPAHATGLRAHSTPITAQVHVCPAPATSGTCT
jgi:signal peptidase I